MERLEEEAKGKEVRGTEYNPPPPTPEIKQKKASQVREDRPPPRARRESDAVSGPVMNEVRSLHLDIDYY